jgi:hypothetical protein
MTVCVPVPVPRVVVVVVMAVGVVVVVVAPPAGSMLPKSPCDPTLGPAVKYSVFVGPAAPPLPNDRPQSPSILSALLREILSGPRNFQWPFAYW